MKTATTISLLATAAILAACKPEPATQLPAEPTTEPVVVAPAQAARPPAVWPDEPFRATRPVAGPVAELTLPQVEILARAGRQATWRIDGRDDEAACLALWRAGLLRVNGGSGFELSLLGRAALQAQMLAGRGSATGDSGERVAVRQRPAGEAAGEAARL